MRRGRPTILSDDALLDAAQAVLLEKGLDATTADVARKANISESVIFHRFKTKEAMFIAILERRTALDPEMKELSARAGNGDIADHLHVFGTALIDKVRALLPFFMLLFSSPLKMNLLREWVQQAHPKYFRLLNRYFEQEARLGRLKSVSTQTLAGTYLGGIREYVFTELLSNGDTPLPVAAPQYLREMIEILLRGVAEENPIGSSPKHTEGQ